MAWPLYIERLCLHVQATDRDNPGRVWYYLEILNPSKGEALPHIRTLQRLARKFLGCELQRHKELPPKDDGFFFTIAIGTSREDRSAFLGAVAANMYWAY